MEPKQPVKPKYLGKMLEPLDFFESDFKTRQDHIEDLLCRHLNMKTVVAFIGAGTSLPLGYPNWGLFATDIVSILILIFENEDLFDVFRKPFDINLLTEIRRSSLEKLFNYSFTEEVNKAYTEELKTGGNIALTENRKKEINRQISDKLIQEKWNQYHPVLAILGEEESKDAIKTAREVYDANKLKIQNNNFQKYLIYLKNSHYNELDALFIFSECERLLNSKDSWEENKQSGMFRTIVKIYFDLKYTNAKGTVEEEIAVIRAEKKKESIEKKENRQINDEEFRQFKESERGKLKNLKAEEKGWLYEKYNPYFALLKLPIKKFTTFNYDLEIERALLYKGRIKSSINQDAIYEEASEVIINACKLQSFSQEKQNRKELANFSIARNEGSYNNVFHCHGRIDDTKNCIVSEEDYKKWYLVENTEEYLPFRQTLDLALDSNPILFIGFGLKDTDLMRILRTITANRSTEKTRNPLFCLLYVGINDIKESTTAPNKQFYKWDTEVELQDECSALYMKYGLHVIPVWEREFASEEGTAICLKLANIHESWRNWWEGILKKPKFRSFNIQTADDLYFHYKFEFNEWNFIDNFDEDFHPSIDKALGFTQEVKTEENITLDKFNSDHSVFAENLAVVVGDGGTGKSWSIQSYLEKKADEFSTFNKNPENLYKKKIFYWSSYYANDVLTGIDRLIRFFKTEEEIDALPKKSKFDWLKEIVNCENESIIVFDGIEKLLNPNKENTEGESVSPEVKEFFKIISNGNAKRKIILTTRLFPTDIFHNFEERLKNEKEFQREIPQTKSLLDLKSRIKNEQILSAPRCWSIGLKNVELSNDQNEIKELRSQICSLFEGHILGISLIKGIIDEIQQNTNEIDFIKKIKSIIRNIANTPIEKRIDRMIREAIKDIDKIHYPEFDKIAEKFIQRIALFMHPIRKEVVEVCFDEIKKQLTGVETKEIDGNFGLLDTLLEKGLVQKVFLRKGANKQENGYVVHPLIRTYVFERLHESRFSSFPSLQLPGFTSAKDVVDPGSKEGKKVAADLFTALCEKATDIKDQIDKKVEKEGINKEENNKSYEIASDMCRSAFSILRSRFCSNTVARWGNYSEYTKMTLLLYDTAKKVSSAHWSYCEPTPDGFRLCSKPIEPVAPLYPDELAWVYNEVGLASQSMGNNLNATALWEQGYEINKIIDREKDGRYLFQSNINLGAIYIYYGKLNIARDYLSKAFEIANKLENKKLSYRVSGYIALVKYLRGNLEESNSDFERTCEELAENSRARAVFMNFHGELLLKLDKPQEALEKIEQSRHIAQSNYYPDLIAYARLSKANYYAQQSEHIEAQNEFQFALKFARDKHLRRLEAATLSGMSRLAEKLGDFSTAIRLAVDSLKVSNEYLLSLHQTQGLIVLGKALINGHHHRDLGIACLQTARDLAQKQEYFLRMNEAQIELAKHNIT